MTQTCCEVPKYQSTTPLPPWLASTLVLQAWSQLLIQMHSSSQLINMNSCHIVSYLQAPTPAATAIGKHHQQTVLKDVIILSLRLLVWVEGENPGCGMKSRTQCKLLRLSQVIALSCCCDTLWFTFIGTQQYPADDAFEAGQVYLHCTGPTMVDIFSASSDHRLQN